MADNSSVPVASGNETFANDDIGGVKYPRPKINWGADGTANDVDTAAGKALPVQLRDNGGTEILTAAQVVSLLGYVDGLETLIGTTNSNTTSTNTKLDTLHTDVGSSNTKLDTLHTDLGATLAVAPDTSTIRNGATVLTPKFAKITASASGATVIVAAVSTKKLRVLSWDLMPNAAVNAKWQSHTAGDISGLYYMSGQGNGVARNFSPVGHFETTAGESLDLNLSGAVAVGGSLVYVEV